MTVSRELLQQVRTWAEKADNDLRTAEHTLTIEENCPFDAVCFHAQQCAEKYLKALLIFRAIDFPRTHDLAVLVRLVPPELRPGVEPKRLLSLNRFAVEARYPGDWEPILLDEAERAVGVAREVRSEVRSRLPQEVLDPGSQPDA